MGFDDDERAEGDEFSQQLEEKVSQSAKYAAKKGAKKAGKAVAKAGGKALKAGAKAVASGVKAAATGLANLFIVTLPWSAIILGVLAFFIILLMVIENYFGGLRDIFRGYDEKDSAFDASASSAWADFSDAKYEEDKIDDWLNGVSDPDSTALMAQTVINNEDAGEKIWEEDPSHTAGQDTYIQDMMRNEHMLLAQDDMIDIMKKTFNYDKRMFHYEDHWYQYMKWGSEEFRNGAEVIYKWGKKKIKQITTENRPNSDQLYRNLSRIHIEGEREGANYKFAVHWQDVMALANFFSYCNYDNWGNTGEDSEYDPKAEGTEINGTNGYYMSDEDIDRIFALFKYNFTYYWDGVDEHSHADESNPWEFDKLSNGTYPKLAYRYKKLRDPDGGEGSEVPEGYPGEAPYTRFVPESAPNMISNSWETYKYIYIKTSEVPDYTPDPENYEPPEGWFCIGRWKMVDPQYFIESVSTMCPWYQERALGEKGQKFVEQTKYNWTEDMIQTYVEMREYLPNTAWRNDIFMELAELYTDKKVILTYEGVKYDGMKEYVAQVKANKPGWEVEFKEDESNISDDFYPNEEFNNEDESCPYPFWSYGVTYKADKIENKAPDDNERIDPEIPTPRPEPTPGAGDVYIYEHAGKMVDGWFTINEGADTSLIGTVSYSEGQIRAMLTYLERMSRGIPFSSATADVYAWHQSTQADVAALLAIIITEGGHTSRHGVNYWNFFDFTAQPGESTYPGSHNWWNAKADCGTIGVALTRGMGKIYRNYWQKGQDTFYKMCFNKYGYPQSREEAIARDANPGFSHCYCPWWEDTGYIQTGFNSDYSWCNKNAGYRLTFQNQAGGG